MARFLAALAIVLSMAFPGALHAQAPRPKLALVIGNSDYNVDGIVDVSDAAIQKAVAGRLAYDLANPVSDATDIAAALRAAGFKDVRVLKNANRTAMGIALNKFSDDVKAAGDSAMAIVYFAGHGASIEGTSYLIPAGARLPEIRSRGIDAGGIIRDAAAAALMPDAYRESDRKLKELFAPPGGAKASERDQGSAATPSANAAPQQPAESRVIKQMEQRHAELGAVFYSVHDLLALFPTGGSATRLIILDNCRDNPFFTDDLNTKFSLITPRFTDFALMMQSMSRETNAPLAIAASKPGTVALDGEGRNSPFAVALKRHISQRDVTIDEMVQKVFTDVTAATKGAQEPFYLSRGSKDADCIVSCPAATPAPEAAPAP